MEIYNIIGELCKMLREDQDFYYSWQSNIAMSFKDAFSRRATEYEQKAFGSDLIHAIANEAAMNFLDLFIKEPSHIDKMLNQMAGEVAAVFMKENPHTIMPTEELQ